jgi:hypothetical protein
MSVFERNEWICVCRSEETVAFDPSKVCAPCQTDTRSPIDSCIQSVTDLIKLGAQDPGSNGDIMGQVVILGMVSATEEYCRAIIAKLISACPISRKSASTQSLAFSAVDYYGRDDLGFGLLEHISFADGEAIKKHIKNILDIQIGSGSSAAKALEQFDLICHLRHSAAHSSGKFAVHNIIGLRGITGVGRQVLSVDIKAMQIAAKICLNTSRAINRLVYSETIKRWRHHVLTGDWNSDKVQFTRLYRVFYSYEDRLEPERPLLVVCVTRFEHYGEPCGRA